MIEIEINGQTIEVENGEKLISVCDKQDIAVPRFCYHKDLSIAANCRMCLVEIEGNPKPQPACSTSVYAGMKVNTKNQKVKDSQKAVMEFLLINHPLDCPVCDQGGECELQDVAINYGSGNSFFTEGKRVVKDGNLGALIHTEMTRCIHCTRCVRFGDEVAGMSEMGGLGRGEDMSIATFVDVTVDSELSGNMIDVCPVGALTSKPFKFSIRSWQMTNHPSVARHDLLGSNINVQTFEDKVYRISARENQALNSSWISDRDRFSYTSLTNEHRLLNPAIKIDGVWKQVAWQEALDFAIKGLKDNVIVNNKGSKLATLVSQTATLEELYLLKNFTSEIGGSCEYRFGLSDLDTYSYLDSTINPVEIEKVKDIVIIGTNPRFDEPMLNYSIRRAVLDGAVVRVFIVNDSDFNYSVDKNIVKSVDFASLIADLDLNANSLVVLGNEIHTSGNISKINLAVQKTASKILNITTSGNTISARKLDFMSQSIYDKDAYILFDLGKKDLTKKIQADIEKANFVIGLNSFNSINDLADVVLPIAAIYETAGSFIGIDEKVQSFSACVNARGDSKPGWKVIKVLADLLELKNFDFVNINDVKNRALIYDKIIDNIAEITAKVIDKTPSEIVVKTIYSSDEYVRYADCLQVGANNKKYNKEYNKELRES